MADIDNEIAEEASELVDYWTVQAVKKRKRSGYTVLDSDVFIGSYVIACAKAYETMERKPRIVVEGLGSLSSGGVKAIS